MAVSRDGTAIAKVGYGTAEIQKISWGTTELWSAVGGPVFPQLVDVQEGTFHSNGTSTPITLSPLAQAGDTYVLFFSYLSQSSNTLPNISSTAKWERLTAAQGDSISGLKVAVFTGKHGTVSSSTTVSTGSGHRTYQLYTFRNAFHVQSSTGVLGNGFSADPPLLDLTYVKPYTWMVYGSFYNGVGREFVDVPSGFSNYLRTRCGIDGSDSYMATARRELQASSLNPGLWSASEYVTWLALTAAVIPNMPAGMNKEGSWEITYSTANNIRDWTPDPAYPGTFIDDSVSSDTQMITQSEGGGHRVQARLVVLSDTAGPHTFRLRKSDPSTSSDTELYSTGQIEIPAGTSEITLTADNVTLNRGGGVYAAVSNHNVGISSFVQPGSWLRITKP